MSSASKRATNALVSLAVIIAALAGALALGVYGNDQKWTPGLALDLAGGTQIILQPASDDGTEITEEVLNQTVEIIRRRVDASGVAEAEVSTQGGRNVVVALPGTPSDATLDLVRKSAQLQFRPVLYVGGASQTTVIEPLENQPTVADGTFSSYEWITEDAKAAFIALDCTDPANLVGVQDQPSDLSAVTCQEFGLEKYILGPVELGGLDIDTANSGPELRGNGIVVPNSYEVRIEFTGDGSGAFSDITRRLFDLTGDRNRFAMVLDGVVISAPSVQAHISGGSAQISGNFTTPESAEDLANQLRFGALPLTLEVQSTLQVSATLGPEQLQRGLLAGLIGLILVVVYSLFQYRALGLVTVSSLIIAGALTYGTIGLLSWGIGYRLSLAGVAGLIVAIGITADSFIVYFERVRDELRDGRSLASAVEHAWARARRTILASDAVSLLAAVVLYSTAVGGVRGFAFTLGLITVIDVLVVFVFTHPLLVLLARTKFFGGGHVLSGFDPRQLGREAIYKGRGRVRSGGPTLAEKKASASEGVA